MKEYECGGFCCGLFPHHRYELPKEIWGDEAPFLMTTSLNFLPSQPPESRFCKQDSSSPGWGKNTASLKMDVEARCLDSNQVRRWCGAPALGKNRQTPITLLETARAGPFLKFTSQGVINGSVCWFCGCDRCDGT